MRTVALAAVLALGSKLATADDLDAWSAADDPLAPILSAAPTCLQDSLSEGARCVTGWALDNHLFEPLALFVTEQGQARLDENFRFVSDMGYSPSEGRLNGRIDAVLPLTSSAPAGAAPNAGAFFFQPGVTRWVNDHGNGRSDFHFGAVRRFAMPERTRLPGVLGVYAFIQKNREFQHTRFVVGGDYESHVGRGFVSLYVPDTGWRAADVGYEERALAGAELGMRLDVTTTVSMSASVSRWENGDGLGGWSTERQMALGWRPHPWLDVGVKWSGIGARDRETAFRVGFEMPLGGNRRTPEWEGLGIAVDRSDKSVIDPWRPVENFEGIRVARREAVYDQLISEAVVRFLQESASTGGMIRLEVRLPSATPHDLDLVVTLSPGTGEVPAVPGVDFVDEPIPVTVRAGAATAVVTVQLPLNSELSEPRSLRATVALAS